MSLLHAHAPAATDYAVREASPADTPRILELVRRSLGEGLIPRDETFWRWKHEENPFGASACLIAESDGEIIGLRVFMRWRWQVRGAVVSAVRAVDTATDARWRGRGIFSRLTMALVAQMRREGVAFVFNTPNQYSMPGYLKMGWSSVGRTSLWIRPRRPWKLLRPLLRQRQSAQVLAEDRKRDVHAGSSILALLHEGRLVRCLSDANEREPRLCTPLSVGYLEWRYAHVPGFQYEARWVLDSNANAVVICRRKSHAGYSELRISELVIGEGSRSARAGRRVLRDLIRASDCDVVTVRSRGAGTAAVLISAGFIPAPRSGPTFTVRPLNDIAGGTDPLQRRNWAPSIGDLEIF